MSPSATAITLVISGLTLGGIAFGRLPGVRVSRAGVALGGAMALVLLGVVDLDDARRSVNGEVLLLLFGLMVVNASLAGAGAFRLLTTLVTRGTLGPRRLLALLVMASGLLSALFLNDTVVLMLTPLVVRAAQRLGLRPLPYLLGLALAANAGSVATVTGNPQNVLVAVSAGIGYGEFVLRLGPVALASLAITLGVILVAFRRDLRGARRPHEPLAPALEVDGGRLWLSATTVLAMLVAFVAGVPVALAALAAAAFLLLSHGRAAAALLRRVDYELLVLFGGLFVVVGALAETGLPARWLLGLLASGAAPAMPGAADLGRLTVVTAGLSNVVSNVPAVLILLPTLDLAALQATASKTVAITLAMASTLAGNLTLVASVANLIVAESARRLGVEVGFWSYLRVGLPVTVLTLFVGWLIVAFA
ncbi:MAG: SLC13 family permease [Trueperaceae bacterium]